MTGILIAFVIAIVLPLFAATWRTSLLGLAVQGGLIARLALQQTSGLTFDTALVVVDVVVLRTMLAPALLYRSMRRQNAPPRNDVIPPNLLSWAVAVSLVVVAFRAADALVPLEGQEQMLVAVATSALALGLFVLATSRGTFSQIIGILRIENGIALFELGGHRDHDDAAIRVGMTTILLVSILFYRWYLDHVPAGDEPTSLTDSAAL